jgi:hypothetical protein
MAYKDKDKRVVSIRKFIALDFVSDSGFIIIQWGSDPVKFICYLRKGGRAPVFLYSIRWFIKVSLGNFRAGYTYKPINLRTFWRTQCAQTVDLAHYRRSLTKISKTSSQTGSPTPTQE